MKRFVPFVLMALPAALPAQQQTLLLNEFLAKNDNGLQDEAGQNDDWIEIINVSPAPVSASGMYLTDRPQNLTKWQIPSGWTIQPGGTLLVWADENGSQGPLHANFKLNADGEDLLLVAADGTTILDQITFGPQVGDVSTGRLYDGVDQWVTFLDPTPAATNEVACGHRRYSALDPTLQTISLGLAGTPSLGQTVTFELRGGSPNTVHALLFSIAADEVDLPVGTAKLLLALPMGSVASVNSDANGAADVPLTIPNLQPLVGFSLYLQGWTLAGADLLGSNGLEVKVCQ